MITMPASLALALEHHKAGRLQAAKEVYQQVLQIDPYRAEALHSLGVVAHQQGEHELALTYMSQALQLRGDSVPLLNNLGEVYRTLGRLSEAIDCFRRALQLKSDIAELHNNLGNALKDQGQTSQAITCYHRALQLAPNYAEAHLNLGNALKKQKQYVEAIACFQRALQLKPDLAEAYYSLGNTVRAQGRTAEAITCYQRALYLKPDDARTHNNLGIALQSQEQTGEAIGSFRQALHWKPDYMQAHINLGNALQFQGHTEEAMTCFQRAVQLKPGHAEAHNNLGNALQFQGQSEEAIVCYRRALNVKPDFFDAYNNLGNALMDQGLIDEATAAYRRVVELCPGDAAAHSKLINVLHYHPHPDSQGLTEELQRWHARHAAPLARLFQPHDNDPDTTRRLRIGYVSPDFREHVDSFFVMPLLSNHDHRQFEVFCYADVARPDATTERLRSHVDVWRRTVACTDRQVADLVRSDQIDVLIDLELHEIHNRLRVFACKPAPVQVTWLGYPGTTGLSAIDYRLTDSYLDPPGSGDACYAEQSFRLQDTFWCYDPLTDQPTVGPLPAVEHGVITFGCLNKFYKINDQCLVLWAKVLQAVPRSRLLLLVPQGQARQRVLARLEQEGVGSARVEFAARQPRADYLKLHHHIDIGLDPLPYNGHTTSLDAIWMGVPIVTQVGNTVVGRAGLSILSNVGLPELVAYTPEQFVIVAATLAGDLEQLATLRAGLRGRIERSPLMDAPRFARNVEGAFRAMWQRWCAGRQGSS
jgi:protein O-GlcNAc transferase